MESCLANTYKRMPLEIVRGKGSVAYDAQGKEYIDLGSGIGVNLLGYCDEGWTKAVTEQLQQIQHCSNLYDSAPAAELAQMLCQRTGMSRVFFSNSGAEANECAIKVARKWAETEKGLPQSYIITLNRSFHGRTIATLSATGQEVYHQHFAPLLSGFLHCEVGDKEGLERLIQEYPCSAIMVEVVQGEGGVMPIGREFAEFVQECADKNNLLLITDEVQLGNGRSGKLYGYMHYGLRPDIVTTAKGLGGGLPIGAALLGARVAEVLQPGMHGSTFGGNPVVCAGGVEIMRRLDADFLRGVEERSTYIRNELEQAEGISCVSGLGLMLGFVPPVPAREFAEELLSEGVLVTTAKDKIRLLPPLNIPMDLLKSAVQTIKCCAASKGGTPMNFKDRHFLTLLDYTPEEITALIDLAADLKAKKKAGIAHDTLKGKNIALIFEKTSTRTRCSFEVAAHDLGMHVTYLDPSGSQIGKKESIADTARVLGRLYDGIEYRGFGQEIVEELAKHAGVPVWNGLTNEYHPTQILADMLTIREHFGELKGKKFVFMGDCRYNMANSLMIGCAKLGLDFVACGPEGYFPVPELIEKCEKIAAENGCTLAFETDPMKAVENADIIYTDVWVSMGEPMSAWEERINKMLPYQVNAKLMAAAKETAVFMHCLPAFHDMNTGIGREMGERFGLDALEVTDEVFESKQSIVFDEAENRMHTIKAVLYATLS